MSVPHRQLYRVVPSKGLMVSADRSGLVSGFQLLHPTVSYVMTAKYMERLREEDAAMQVVPVDARPLTGNCTSLLVFFPGGIGDVIALKTVLQDLKWHRPELEVAVVSTIRDRCLLDDTVTLFDYPITEAVANKYDAWINIAEMDRASVGQELPVTFAEYVGIEPPRWQAVLSADTGLMRAMQGYIRDWTRPKIGVHLASACHFRSIPNWFGATVMMGLVDRGCDCYQLGGPNDMIPWKDNGVPCQPPDHIYDMIPVLAQLEYYMAFIEHLDVLLTCDTGAMHIAGALGVPTLALFGMTDGAQRTSYYNSVDFVQGQKDCSPCENIWQDVPCPHEYCLSIAEMNPQYIVDKVMEKYLSLDTD